MGILATYQCNNCKKLTVEVVTQNWIQIISTGVTNISEGVVTKLRIKPTERLHFCSIKCMLEYLVSNITNGEDIDDYSDAIREILDTNKPVKIKDKTISRIDEFTISLQGTVPADIWNKEVLQLGLNPDDYLTVVDNDNVNMTKIINIYKEYYYDRRR